MKTTLQRLLVLGGTFALAVCGTAQNLLTNGGFELPGGFPDHSGTYLTYGDTRLIGWTVESKGGLIALHNGTAGVFDFPAIDGTYHVAFNGADTPAGSSLAQNFDTIAGNDYLASFYVGRLGGGPGDMSITTTATSSTAQLLGSMVATPPSHGYGVQQFFSFRATTPTTTLRLQDTSTDTGGVDVALDAVSVTALAAGSDTSLGLLPVLSIQVASVGLSFPAELNRFYQLQFTPNLSTGNWLNLGAPIQGFGSNVVVTDSILGQPTKMYRVVPSP
jgi:hypothetical protein